ncbi:hypothetical protein [Bradyrhizobium sp.]|uniref:hypothetical protein n=1 Tax=Bradyrhizobium sp. TaxID=376 RepID=UPI003C6441DB
MWIKHALLISSLVMASCGFARAQEPPAPATPPQQTVPPLSQGSTSCAPTTGGTVTPEGATVGQSNAPLGDKLAKSNGVLCPPSGVDPEMRAPTPDTGNTPVIPPPGSPGGNPNVQPK